MSQIQSLRSLFGIWRADPAAGVKKLNNSGAAFGLRSLLNDSDGDGLPDTLEHTLLEKFRPYLKFSKNFGDQENNRPVDAWWYAQHCEVLYDAAGGLLAIGNDVMSVTPDSLLNIQGNPVGFHQIDNPADAAWGPSDINKNPQKTKIHLTVIEQARAQIWAGAGWDEVLSKGNVGLYGHVVPMYMSDNNQKEYFKIEYWLLCGLNNAQAAGALNHEADWMTVQLIYDPDASHLNQNKISEAVFQDNGPVFRAGGIHHVMHYAHGNETRFIMDNASSTGNIKDSFQTTFLEFRDGGDSLRFAQEPQTNAWSHPVVYIQYGEHEFYPTDGEIIYPNHDGEGHSFLCATPPNLGEVGTPNENLLGANLIVGFNGYWGYFNETNPPPPGPILHTEWSWPPDITDAGNPHFRDNSLRINIKGFEA